MTKREKVGLGVLIAAGVISLAFIIWFITVTCVKLADARKEAERNAQEAFAAAWNPEEIYAQFEESMNEIKEDAKRRSEENVRMLNEFSERMRDAAEMEDEDERARAIEEVMNDQAEWMNGLNVSE